MEPASKRRERFLSLSVVILLVLLFGLMVWIYTAPFRFFKPAVPSGSPVSVHVWASYVNDTGTVTGTRYVEGVNISLLDTNNGNVSSVGTSLTVMDVSLVVGHNYRATATLGVSSKSAEAIVGGYGGVLYVMVWDNRTLSSMDFLMITP